MKGVCFQSISAFCVEAVYPSGAVVRVAANLDLKGKETFTVRNFSRPRNKGDGSTRHIKTDITFGVIARP